MPGQDIKIAAVMSLPRVAWTETWGCVADALRPFGIPVKRHTGAYWGIGTQKLFEECVSAGCDWILAIDYDTMFTKEHLDRLIGWFGQRPDIGALAALQCRRAQGFPLMTIEGETRAEINGEPLKVTTAHFGLTLIRCEDLVAVPKPWFKGEPDANGEWGSESIHADIWFWHQWRLAGKTAYVAPDVRIGHLELLVSEFDENMEPRHAHVNEWRERQKTNGRLKAEASCV